MSVAVALAASPLLAQQPAPSGVLNGIVHDPLGAVVVRASVDLLEGSQVKATTSTGPDGRFRFDLASGGRYRVRVTAATFEPTSTTVTYFKDTGPSELDVTLATPTLTQEMTVTVTGTPTPEAQSGETVTVLPAEAFQHMLEVQEPLRLVPGLQVTQSGQLGQTTGLSIRGGDHDANKVLLDGVPANSIGGAVEFANIATVGIEAIEVLNEPDSVLYGSDAMAGVVSLTSARAVPTRLPVFTYAGDAGNFHTYRNEGTAGGTYRQFDLYSAYARVQTSNNIQNSEFHNGTFVGNFGWTPNASNDARLIVRHVNVSGGQPNAIAFFGIADDAQQKEQDLYLAGAWNNQATARWHNLIRYGYVRLNGQFNDFAATGIPDPNNPGYYDGAPVSINGANEYSVSGQALFQYSNGAPPYLEHNSDSSLYAQTDFRMTPHVVALGAFKYESESGSSGSVGTMILPVSRGNYDYSVELSGDLKNRLFYTVGTGLEKNGLYGFAETPRASLAYYLLRPSTNGFFTGTKLHGTFSKGIKEPSVFEQTNSLDAEAPPAVIAQDHLTPLGPETSRTFDGGVDQQFENGRVRLGITYFHDEFSHRIENVPQNFLVGFGIDPTDIKNFPYGAYLNLGALRSQGIEVSTEFRPMRSLFARAGYTYTDAVVQHSLASAVTNTASNFSDIPIGAYAPLQGARPFRVAPHTGYFDLTYQRSKLNVSLSGTLVGRRDDSTFLTDSNFGNSLLLPNRNLDGAYQRLELGGGYQLTPRVNVYANIQNLLSERFFEAFGFPALPLTFRTGLKMNFGGETWKLK